MGKNRVKGRLFCKGRKAFKIMAEEYVSLTQESKIEDTERGRQLMWLVSRGGRKGTMEES